MSGTRSATLRLTICRLFACSCLLAVSAGSAVQAQVVVGAKVGLNQSNFRVTENGVAPVPPYESRTGLVVGATTALRVTHRLSLQLEGRYAQQGVQRFDQGSRGVIALSYVEVPLVARLSVLPADAPMRPCLHAGGFVRFETACNVHISGLTSADLDCDTAIPNERKTTDYGVNVGGGADVRFGPGDVMLNVEYAYGLRNLSEDPTVKIRSRVLGFTVGYRIPVAR
jgi:hypothetical protein